MRLIDADAIPYTMLYKENWLAGTGCEEQGAWKDDIDAMPTIEERKKGKWERHYSRPNVYADCFWHCTCCGYKTLDNWANKWNYCPNCGADMRGDAHE